jgi:hypothetical protein
MMKKEKKFSIRSNDDSSGDRALVFVLIGKGSCGVECVGEALARRQVTGVPQSRGAGDGVRDRIGVGPQYGRAHRDGYGGWLKDKTDDCYSIGVQWVCYYYLQRIRLCYGTGGGYYTQRVGLLVDSNRRGLGSRYRHLAWKGCYDRKRTSFPKS